MTKGDTIFVGQYLFTRSETTSVWLEVNALLILCLCIVLQNKICAFRDVYSMDADDFVN